MANNFVIGPQGGPQVNNRDIMYAGKSTLGAQGLPTQTLYLWFLHGDPAKIQW